MRSDQGDEQDARVDPREVGNLLARLLDKSLVIFEEGPDGGRFRLQELVREYGREEVSARGEAESIRRRLAEYYTGLTLEAEKGLSSREQPAWLHRLETEHDNIRAALEVALADPSGPDQKAAQIAGAIWRFWYFHGYLVEGRRWLERIMERRDLPSDLRAKALNGAGAIAREAGDYQAARAFHEESIALFRDLGDDRGRAGALGNLGNLALNQKDYGAAEALYRSSIALYRKLGDRQRAAYSLNNLGVVARHHGDLKHAWELYEEALAIHREVGNLQWEGITLSNLGSLAHHEGQYHRARDFQTASLAIRRSLGDRAGVAISLDAFAALEVVAGDEGALRRAARLYGAAHALRQQTGAALHADDLDEWERDVAVVRARLGEEQFEEEWIAGHAISLDGAIAMALESSAPADGATAA